MRCHSGIMLIVCYSFLHMSGVRKCMLRAFHKDSTPTQHSQDSNPNTPDPEAKCLPLYCNATAIIYQYFIADPNRQDKNGTVGHKVHSRIQKLPRDARNLSKEYDLNNRYHLKQNMNVPYIH